MYTDLELQVLNDSFYNYRRNTLLRTDSIVIATVYNYRPNQSSANVSNIICVYILVRISTSKFVIV